MVEPLTLDVRDDLHRGAEPFPRIMQAVGCLSAGQGLRLLTNFEPLPLYAVLGKQGFAHRAVRHGEGDWEVLFSPQGAPPQRPGAAPTVSAAAAASWAKPSTYLDNRGLLPPEPMVRILDALEHLNAGEVLEALNEREPVFLYPELQARGAAVHTEKTSEGVRILVRRAGATP